MYVGICLHSSGADGQQISAMPHPYNSHANDYIRDYILTRVRSIADEYKHVRVFDDLRSNGSWASEAYGVYFEGTNILVKIEGTDPQYWEKGGVLFSAHYDSVSTAPGTTDDGMGVATLLQLIEYFAKNREPRTAIFNINNGEEDWLNGAHAYVVL
jgi:acetylornithine deacetylase/succinyl-diaminopimelate desuccinylase-like protein